MAGLVVAVAVYLLVQYLRPVAQVAEVVSGRAINSVPGSVQIMAESTMELKSEVSGRIIYSELDPGRSVTKGELLVQLDTGDVALDIERIKNDIVAARRKVELGSTLQAEVLNMRDTVANYARQAEIRSYPQAELEKQRRLLHQIEQRMELDEVNSKLALDNNENALRTKEREKEKMSITAPQNGTISEVYFTIGDLIGSNTSIATLISDTRVVEARISEENFAGIRVGQKASVRFLGYGDQLYPGAVTKVLPTANAETQRYVIHLKVELPDDKLVPGLTGEVSIIIGEREAKTTIPRRALRGREVFVVTGGRVQTREVEVGYVSLTQVEILSGLEPGEEVIVEDLDLFRPGMRVRTHLTE